MTSPSVKLEKSQRVKKDSDRDSEKTRVDFGVLLKSLTLLIFFHFSEKESLKPKIVVRQEQ